MITTKHCASVYQQHNVHLAHLFTNKLVFNEVFIPTATASQVLTY